MKLSGLLLFGDGFGLSGNVKEGFDFLLMKTMHLGCDEFVRNGFQPNQNVHRYRIVQKYIFTICDGTHIIESPASLKIHSPSQPSTCTKFS